MNRTTRSILFVTGMSLVSIASLAQGISRFRNLTQRITFRTAALALSTVLAICETHAQATLHGGVLGSKPGSAVWHPRADLDYDGNRLLGHVGHNVYLWDVKTGKILQTFLGAGTSRLQLSPDGKFVLASSGDLVAVGDVIPDRKYWPKEVSTQLWDITTGKEIWKLPGQRGGVFSQDGKRLITFSLIGSYGTNAGLALWEVSSGKKIVDARVSSRSEALPVDAISTSLAFSPDGRTFVSLDNIDLRIWNANTGRELGNVKHAESFIFYGTDGNIATFDNRAIDIWTSDAMLINHTPTIQFAQKDAQDWTCGNNAWLPDGSRLVGGNCKTNVLQLWDPKVGEVATIFLPTLGYFIVGPDCRHFLYWWNAGGELQHLELAMYDLSTREELWNKRSESLAIVGFAPDGKTFLADTDARSRFGVGKEGSEITIYDSDTGGIVKDTC